MYNRYYPFEWVEYLCVFDVLFSFSFYLSMATFIFHICRYLNIEKEIRLFSKFMKYWVLALSVHHDWLDGEKKPQTIINRLGWWDESMSVHVPAHHYQMQIQLPNRNSHKNILSFEMNIYEPCTRNDPAVFLIPQTRTVKYILFSSTQIDVLFSLIWCGTQMNVRSPVQCHFSKQEPNEPGKKHFCF